MRRKICEVEILVEMTGAAEMEDGVELNTDMSIQITKGSHDVPAKVVLASAIGALEAALASTKKQWEKDFGDREPVLKDVKEVRSGRT